MQTFLPYRQFARSAAALDPPRLGKQRVEALQVLRALLLPDYGWQRHPAVTMWRGRVPALVLYGLTCVEAWTAEGRADTTGEQITEFAPQVVGRTQEDLAREGLLPRWVGDGAVHLSHRSTLVRKDPAFYRPVFGDVPDDLPYVWPDPDPGPEVVPVGPAIPLWVVRAPLDDAVGLPLVAPSGRASPKFRRQLDAFGGAMRVGDLVAVPVDGGAGLLVGLVAGEVRSDDDRVVRPVRWTGRLPRAAVRPPALLQDPRLLFRVPVDEAALS